MDRVELDELYPAKSVLPEIEKDKIRVGAGIFSYYSNY